MFIVCPCTDDVPFEVPTLEEARNFTSTQEYYVVDTVNRIVLIGSDDAWELQTRGEN